MCTENDNSLSVHCLSELLPSFPRWPAYNAGGRDGGTQCRSDREGWWRAHIAGGRDGSTRCQRDGGGRARFAGGRDSGTRCLLYVTQL